MGMFVSGGKGDAAGVLIPGMSVCVWGDGDGDALGVGEGIAIECPVCCARPDEAPAIKHSPSSNNFNAWKFVLIKICLLEMARPRTGAAPRRNDKKSPKLVKTSSCPS